MENKLFKNKYLCLILALFLLLLAGCDKKPNMHIDIFSYLRPDGKSMAIRVGPEVGRNHPPNFNECNAVLLELEGISLKRYHIIETQESVDFSMAWHPVFSEQLYLSTLNKLNPKNSSSPGGEFLRFSGNSETHSITTISRFDVPPNISGTFSWSPDGKVLAGLAVSWPHQLHKGKLAISNDGGKTVKLTEIPMWFGSRPVWLNDKEFYFQPNKKTIAKVMVEGLDARLIETIVESEDTVLLRGSFKGECVYCKGKGLFVGEKLILQSKYPLYFAKADKYIIAEADRKVVIFDENLSVCHERPLEENTRLLNFSPNTNIVFLLRNWETILCYDYTVDEKPHILFSTDMISYNKNKTPAKRESKEESHKHVINKAIAMFDEENGLQGHEKYDISVRETAEKWSIDFDGKTMLPGDHALVTINKRTGEMEYFQGE